MAKSYGKLSQDALQQEDQVIQELAPTKFNKIPEGENLYRFLPPRAGSNSIFLIASQHFVDVIPGITDKKMAFGCPRSINREPCVVCEKIEQLRTSGRPGDSTLADSLKPTIQIYANVIDRAHPERGPFPINLPRVSVYEELKKLFSSMHAGGDFCDPVNGFDIVITRVGKGREDTSYSVRNAMQRTPMAETEEEIDAIMERSMDLKVLIDCVIPPQLVAAFHVTSPRFGAREAPVSAQLGGQRPPARAQSRGAGSLVGADLMKPRSAVQSNLSLEDLDDEGKAP